VQAAWNDSSSSSANGLISVRRPCPFGTRVPVTGGAINSPQILQLAGIGNAQELSALGITPVVDLPGVGENLQDHLEVYIQHASKQPVSIAPWMKHRHKPRIGAEWLLLRSG
jgi:choline dehydrogenase